ncbi:basic-leucine zipper transcription factor A-like [Hyalella azteca]|uniref:Basic-leucine zipper transcription factor A-like n=1 Tax=Hyalella azteca TaxID=294128 RepID=A0A979FWE4_HYAAZ|nr:basic-leucine zipper transcription factor A-like [Hyalella azteca]
MAASSGILRNALASAPARSRIKNVPMQRSSLNRSQHQQRQQQQTQQQQQTLQLVQRQQQQAHIPQTQHLQQRQQLIHQAQEHQQLQLQQQQQIHQQVNRQQQQQGRQQDHSSVPQQLQNLTGVTWREARNCSQVLECDASLLPSFGTSFLPVPNVSVAGLEISAVSVAPSEIFRASVASTSQQQQQQQHSSTFTLADASNSIPMSVQFYNGVMNGACSANNSNNNTRSLSQLRLQASKMPCPSPTGDSTIILAGGKAGASITSSPGPPLITIMHPESPQGGAKVIASSGVGHASPASFLKTSPFSSEPHVITVTGEGGQTSYISLTPVNPSSFVSEADAGSELDGAGVPSTIITATTVPHSYDEYVHALHLPPPQSPHLLHPLPSLSSPRISTTPPHHHHHHHHSLHTSLQCAGVDTNSSGDGGGGGGRTSPSPCSSHGTLASAALQHHHHHHHNHLAQHHDSSVSASSATAAAQHDLFGSAGQM